MTSQIFQLFIICSVFLLMTGCESRQSVSVGDVIEYKIYLDLDSEASDYPSGRLENTILEFLVEKSDQIRVEFSKGKYMNGKFSIALSEYFFDKNPIFLHATSEVNGNFYLKLIPGNTPGGVQLRFPGETELILNRIKVQPLWQRYLLFLVVGVIVGLLVLAALVFLKIKRNSFESGYLNVSVPNDTQIDLSGKQKVMLSKHIIDFNNFCVITCEFIPTGNSIDDEEKIPRLEVDVDMYIVLDNVQIDDKSCLLSQNSSVKILNAEDKILLEFNYIA